MADGHSHSAHGVLMLLLVLGPHMIIHLGNCQNSFGCFTVDGADNGSACSFPFTLDGVTQDGCVLTGDDQGLPWCPTQVDLASGQPLSGHLGHCAPNCPLAFNNTEEFKLMGDTADEDGAGTARIFSGDPEQDESIQQRLGLNFEAPKECVASSRPDKVKGTCQPIGLCPSEPYSPSACDPDGLAAFVCCPELLRNQIALRFSTSSDKEDKANVVTFPNVTLEAVETRINLLDTSDPEKKPLSADGFVFEDHGLTAGSPEGALSADEALLRFNGPRKDVLKVDEAANSFLKATEDIQEQNGLDSIEAGVGLRSFNTDTSASISRLCPWTPEPLCDDISHLNFRSMDGSCNNFAEPNYGRAATPFQRILRPSYSGNSLHLPRISVTGFDLPSARVLSQSLTHSIPDDGRSGIDQAHTALVMQMGQFIDHDLTHTPNHNMQCCNSDGSFPDTYDGEKCFPIFIPVDDLFWRGRKTCMSQARSLASPDLKCSLEFRQQMNQITHWLDASNIYGSSLKDSNGLRVGIGGLLKEGGSNRVTGVHGSLPSCADNKNVPLDTQMCQGCDACFLAGDERANEQLNLLVMHTIWLREHNRIATALSRMNPALNDQALFHEARRIVIAEYQHIVYNEWLPTILGNKFMTSFGLWPLTKGYSEEYMDSFDPRVTNEFAASAFRFGHSLIPNYFSHMSLKTRTTKSLGFFWKVKLSDTFFQPTRMKSNPLFLDELAAGLPSQAGQSWDNGFAETIRNHLFEPSASTSKGTGGLDLVALNIQRGRDHGLPGYNQYREVCGFAKVSDWSGFRDLIDPTLVDRLKLLYAHVDDVDLFVGGFLENKHEDSAIGPTFKCILGDTFARIKLGDRFFYDLGNDGASLPQAARQTKRFSLQQLDEIRKTSMARVMCDNTEFMSKIQPLAFKIAGSVAGNVLRLCSDLASIPAMDLIVFKV